MLAGCATPGLRGVIPYKTELTEANNAIQNSYLPPPRGTQQSEWQATLDRVTEKISPALQKTCLSVGAANCWASDTNRISIIHEPTINAFVDGDHRIGVHSGLIQNASSDEEIAAVIAHEYGHIFAGHIGKQGSNAGLGVLAGIAVGAILTNETGVNQIEDWVSVGDSMGAMAYSQQFELEADYYSTLILSNAGIDLNHGRNVLLRLARAPQGRSSGWGQKAMLMAKTHPSNDYRIARWMGHTQAIGAGKVISPSGNDAELRWDALSRLFSGHNGIVRAGNMSRWINPKTGASGTMTIAVIKHFPMCSNEVCASYTQEDHLQSRSGKETRYACWKPGGEVKYYLTKKPWSFFGGAKKDCPGSEGGN